MRDIDDDDDDDDDDDNDNDSHCNNKFVLQSDTKGSSNRTFLRDYGDTRSSLSSTLTVSEVAAQSCSRSSLIGSLDLSTLSYHEASCEQDMR